MGWTFFARARILSAMRIHFLGATRTTTGSMYLLEINGQRLLLECGLFQGRRGESIERNRNFPFDPKQIDAVVLSHAHIDHCGNLPNLCRQGFEGNIYCTFATRDLASIMLEDSAQIQRDDAAFVSKKRAKHGLPPVEPLYTATDAEKAVRQFVSHQLRPALPGRRRRHGHLPRRRATSWARRRWCWTSARTGAQFRYLFSGDIGRGDDDILRDPQPVEDVDYLQVESTYGAREHAAQSQRQRRGGPAGARDPRAEGQGHHSLLLRRPHPADCLYAAPVDARRAVAPRARSSWTAR